MTRPPTPQWEEGPPPIPHQTIGREGGPATPDRARVQLAVDWLSSEAEALFGALSDGPRRLVTRRDGAKVRSAVTNVELDTAEYVMERFEWTDEAKAWFEERLRDER